MARVVLVTGVSRYLGGHIARAIAADPGIDRVIGVDVVPSPHDLGDPDRVRFVRADIRSPAIGRLLGKESVDTVVHLGVAASPIGHPRAAVKEINVIGSMQLLAACQRLPSLEKLVLRSSTAVYGSTPEDPAMFGEEMEPRALPKSGFGKDAVEVERYVRGFARRRPDVLVTTLRISSLIGPSVNTALTSYLTLPVVPTVLGFDARLQFTHQDDVVEVLRLATISNVPGTINVSGDGVVTLSQALGRLGRPALPVPSFAMRPIGQAYRAAGMAGVDGDQLAFLTYGRGVDTTRMREELKFEPAYTSQQAFASFAAARTPGMLSADRVRAAEETLVEAVGATPRGHDHHE